MYPEGEGTWLFGFFPVGRGPGQFREKVFADAGSGSGDGGADAAAGSGNARELRKQSKCGVI